MNKFLSMAALALVGAMTVSCSSDDNITDQPQQPETKNNVVTLTTTVSLGGDDATRALAADGKKNFAEGETMAVIYENTSGNTVKAVSEPLPAGDYGQSATFTFELTDPDKEQEVTYIYPAAMAGETDVDYTKLNSQDGTLASLAANLDYCTKSGAWDSGNLPTLTLENQLAILAITLKDEAGANDITSSITGLTLSDGTKTYNVMRSAVAGPIYVAIRPTADATITVTATSGTKNYTKTLTTKTYEAGNGYPVNWKMTEVVDPNLLSGIFSVSSTKKVKFSKGNLRYASGTWSFFDNQYDYYTSYSADAWDKFGWSTSATTYGMNISTSNIYSGDFADWGNNSELQTALGTGWFTLSSAEWTYLFNTRTVNGGTGSGKSYTLGQSVNGKLGVVIYPDNYTGAVYSGSDWATFESAGCVFLPAAGFRDGSSVSYVGTGGFYWSAKSYSKDNAWTVSFYSGSLNPTNYEVRYRGYGVRLVREVTE